MVEGVENTRYRSQDLFYEITLVYPHSEYFKEAKIRAENTRAVKTLDELGTLLRKGVKEGGEELLLERARLYRQALEDPAHAQEDYEALIKLFPDSPRREEAYLGLGELALAKDRDAAQARQLWEKGLEVSRDPQARAVLMERIATLAEFRRKVVDSGRPEDLRDGENLVYRLWRVDGDREFALGLLQEALARLENRDRYARLSYVTGRLLEAVKREDEALAWYDRALRSLHHPGLRKDRVFYRMARIQRRKGAKDAAKTTFLALVNRYPHSPMCRSALYWLYKDALDLEKLAEAHDYLSRLLALRSLVPSQRRALQEKERDLAARLDIAEMKRLQATSQKSPASFHYYVGKVLENDLRDYDRAITAYEEYLKSNPPAARSRDILNRMADLAERKGDYARAVGYLDSLRGTMKPASENLPLLIRIGGLVEDRLGNPELLRLFWERIEEEYWKIKPVRRFAQAKLRRIEEKRMAKVEKPKAGKKAKREYGEEEEELLDAIDEIKKKDIDDLQDYTKAERDLVALWDENPQSPVTLEIMRELVALNENLLLDPEKAAEYVERWLKENPEDPEVSDITMDLYDMYMERIRDGHKALRLLEAFVRENPTSPMLLEAELKLARANQELVLNYDEARRGYQRILDTQRNLPIVHEAYYRLAFVLRDGFADYEGAIRLWEEMNNKFYNNQFGPDAQFAMGYTYEAFRRDYANARKKYEEFLQIYPNSPLQNQVREALLRIQNK